MLRLLPTLALLILAAGAAAGELIPRPPILPPPNVKVGAEEQPIQLAKLDLRVTVSGILAETTATMTFRNPNNRILAGELEYPLPDGAAVCGYALDVAGRMVDGVVVGRQKARVVMETEMRRRVDPGLVEHVRGNAFSTRLYPIPAQGERTVRITYVAELSARGTEAAYHLPLPRVPLPALGLRVEVAKGAVKPEISGFGDLNLTTWNDRWMAEATLTNVTPGDDLHIRMPKLPACLVAMEDCGGERFLAVSDLPELAKAAIGRAPQRLALAFDASGSRSAEGVKRDLTLIAGLAKAMGDGVIDLVVVRDRCEPAKAFTIANGVAKDLVDHLSAQALDGGTDLAGLDLRRSALPHADDAYWILATDGLHTLGKGLPATDSVPIHVIASEARRDLAFLRLLAEASNGSVTDLAPGAAEALEDGRWQPLGKPRLLRVDAPAGMLSELSTATGSGGRFQLYARCQADGACILIYGAGGREVGRTTVNVKAAEALSGRIVARAWAAARADQLAVFPEENGTQLLALGQRYGLVTPGTSLLVLENLQQYLEHQITPPDSWPELRDQYLAALKGRQSTDDTRRQAKIEQVVTWWKQRVDWWNRDFAHDKDLRVAAAKAAIGDTGRMGGARSRRTPGEPHAPVAAAGQGLGGGGGDVHFELSDDRAEGAASGQRRGWHAHPTTASGPGAAHPDDPAADKKADAGAKTDASIAIQAWDPNTPYLAAIKARPKAEAYAAYLEQRSRYAASPAFFLDCAGAVLAADQALGLRVLSNLAELRIEDAGLLRVYAWRLREAGALDRAVEILETVARLRPEEPQSHRDLALALAEHGEAGKKVEELIRAARLLYDVVLGDWPRFPQIEVIALMELNRLMVLARPLVTAGDKDPWAFVDQRLIQPLDCDLRITLAWDADNTDVDLHVGEPSAEEAFYGHNLTTIGGLVSRDFTQGYGPEEYVLRKAMAGSYRIRCHYYGSSQQTLLGPATVTATVITNFGRGDERRQILTLRLDKVRDLIDIGAVSVGGEADTKPALSRLTRGEISALKRGATRAAIEKALGSCERSDAAGVTVLVYRLADGTVVRLGLGPDLLWAREVHEGAEREISLAP